jgi:hypothetical protein
VLPEENLWQGVNIMAADIIPVLLAQVTNDQELSVVLQIFAYCH